MADQAKTSTVQLVLEQRVRELEEQNSRLARELQALSHDLAERKKAEEVLADRERQQREIAGLFEIDQARLAAVLRNLPVAIWVADQNGRLIASNPEADRIWAGQPPLVKSTAEYATYTAWHADSEKQLQSEEYPIAMALRTGQPTEPVELKIRRFDGSEGTVLASAAPIQNRQGVVTSAVGINVDITERKRLEEILRESEYRFRTMADGTPIMIWVTNAAGEIEFVNNAYTEFFGVTLDQIQQIGWQILVHPDDQRSYIDEYLFCHKHQKPFHAQGRVCRKDGKWRWIETHSQPRFSGSGEFLGIAGSSLDITERVETEQALRESEIKFHGAFENAAVGYALQTPSGRFIDANTVYCRMLGYSIDELRQLTFFESLHPEDLAKQRQLVDQLLAGDIPDFIVESRYIRKDGQVIWVRKSCSLMTEPSGAPKWLLALIEDITEQKQTEKALRESEQLYRAIGEAIPYGIWICDPDGRNVYASQSYLDLVGITQEQCSEFGWGDTLHPDDAERTISAWKQCVRSEGLWDIEHRFRGKDGQYHPILARGVPVRNDEGKIIYWAGINLDISRLKETEQALKASEEHFRVAIQNSPILVYTTDKELRYTWIYNTPFGVTDEQVIGKTDEELNGPENIGELVALKRSVLETGVGKREEMEWHYPGAKYYSDVTVEPIRDEKGAIAGLTVAAIDITEKRRMEQAAKEDQIQLELQRRLMEEREQERLLIAQEIHDGPTQTLAAAIIELEMAKLSLSDPVPRTKFDHIGSNLKSAVRELRGVISELRPPLLERFGLSQAIRAHAHDFHQKYPNLGLTEYIAEDQGRLSKDACLSLFRIYQEALNNIVRHAKATRAIVRFAFEEGMAVLEIEDNGRGLKEIPDLTSQTAKGHYGLAGMKERAEAVNGQFQLISSEGKGTTVVVKIPVK